MKNLIIKYTVEEKIIPELDTAIKKVAKKLGYAWYASGIYYKRKERELCFEK